MEARADDDTGELGPGYKQLTDDEIIAVCITFLLAGYETTSNLLAFTSYLLAMNPEKQEKLIEEINNYYQEHKVIGCIFPTIIFIYYVGIFSV